MTDDNLPRRLREIHHFRYPGEEAPSTYTEAADEIERLRAELDRARPVIKQLAECDIHYTNWDEMRMAAIRAYQDQEPSGGCICPRFRDTGGFRIADLCCPVHGVNGTDPGDGYWEDQEPTT